ncbi:MAG: DUF2167 domain-containing protein [Pseudomonadota bacterium]|nr:DUF2167 domain-containing protein [Pseudomonadota bacterium]
MKKQMPILAAMIFTAFLLASAILATAPAQENKASETDTSGQAGNSIRKEISEMKWFKNTTATLPQSHGRLVIPDSYSAILGHDAIRFNELINGKSSNSIDEASVISSDFKALTNFQFFDSGYVDEGDWESLNATELLQSVIEATEESNKERRAQGLPEMHVVKWMHQPMYDKNTHTVFWAIEGRDGNGEGVVNSIALRLGRSGFEKLILITNLGDYKPVGGELELMLRAFSFPTGAAYEEHLTTDKAAGYGVATLVGAIVGAKAVKIAAAGGLALFFKPIMAFLAVFLAKAWFLLLLPFIWLKSLIKYLINGRQAKSADATPLITKDDTTQE